MGLERFIHDGYAALAGRFSGMPNLVEQPPSVHCSEQVPVQSAGTAKLDNLFEQSVLPDREAECTIGYPDVQAYRLRDVHTCGDQAQIYFRDGSLFGPSLKHSNIQAHKTRRPIRALARKIAGPVLHFSGPNFDSHGHFFFDFLPRLILARRAGYDITRLNILVACGQGRWQLRYLKHFGIRESQLIETSQGTQHFEELVFIPIPIGREKLADPALYPEVQKPLLREPSPSPSPPIFISRTYAPDKKMLNETEIVDRLRKLIPDLRVVLLSETPLDDQLQLLADTPIVIGPAGQGLTPIAFTRGKLLINLGWTTFFNDPSWIRGFHYLAQATGNFPVSLLNDQPRRADGSWVFNPDLCERVVTDILGQWKQKQSAP
jgi:hypothetical protein